MREQRLAHCASTGIRMDIKVLRTCTESSSTHLQVPHERISQHKVTQEAWTSWTDNSWFPANSLSKMGPLQAICQRSLSQTGRLWPRARQHHSFHPPRERGEALESPSRCKGPAKQGRCVWWFTGSQGYVYHILPSPVATRLLNFPVPCAVPWHWSRLFGTCWHCFCALALHQRLPWKQDLFKPFNLLESLCVCNTYQVSICRRSQSVSEERLGWFDRMPGGKSQQVQVYLLKTSKNMRASIFLGAFISLPFEPIWCLCRSFPQQIEQRPQDHQPWRIGRSVRFEMEKHEHRCCPFILVVSQMFIVCPTDCDNPHIG